MAASLKDPAKKIVCVLVGERKRKKDGKKADPKIGGAKCFASQL